MNSPVQAYVLEIAMDTGHAITMDIAIAKVGLQALIALQVFLKNFKYCFSNLENNPMKKIERE